MSAAWSRRLTVLSAALLALWMLAPLVPLVLWSFARGWRFPAILPDAWSVQGWEVALAARTGLWEALATTLAVAGAATALSVAIGLPAGMALGRGPFRGRRAVELLVLAPVIVPGIAVALGLHGLFQRLGLANTFAGVVLVHLVPTVPYVTLVMASLFAARDPAADWQARSLGAGPWQAFRHVTLPAVMPGLVVAALFAFLVSWSQYILTLMIGGGRVITLPLLLFSQAAAGRNDVTGALAVLYVLPCVAVVALAARRLTGVGPAIAGPGR